MVGGLVREGVGSTFFNACNDAVLTAVTKLRTRSVLLSEYNSHLHHNGKQAPDSPSTADTDQHPWQSS